MQSDNILYLKELYVGMPRQCPRWECKFVSFDGSTRRVDGPPASALKHLKEFKRRILLWKPKVEHFLALIISYFSLCHFSIIFVKFGHFFLLELWHEVVDFILLHLQTFLAILGFIFFVALDSQLFQFLCWCVCSITLQNLFFVFVSRHMFDRFFLKDLRSEKWCMFGPISFKSCKRSCVSQVVP